MKHGRVHRKLSRPSAQRMLMLRNLVSSLLQHQQIKTTLAKAKEAAPLAEKMITLGKKGTLEARREVLSFVLNPNDTVDKLFTHYAKRYKHRAGGYTRIHKFGNRFGDNAPMAVLELVDNPHDLRFAITARAVGRETLNHFLEKEEQEKRWGERLPAEEGAEEHAQELREAEDLDLASEGADRFLRPLTKVNRAKVLKFRGEGGKEQLNSAAREWVNVLLREPEVIGGMRRKLPAKDGKEAWVGKRPWAGQRLTGMDVSRVGLGIAAGVLGRKRWEEPKWAGWDAEKEKRLDRELEELEDREGREEVEGEMSDELREATGMQTSRADDLRSRLREVDPQQGPVREIGPPRL
ncbi:ribosomal protein L17 [Calocera cornea HHB12733]|uniref:Ribosomal protein L17 n=1 Tax=Calocera cornea HHB12733 TaxID=1353952 RepID=A0A165EUC7_9BASI|nr:ribosomal protein L17 [Calocera cornea HHB12733]